MKKFLTVLVLVVAVSFQTNAQERKRMQKGKQDLSAAQMATLNSKKMTLSLDLTTAQEKQVFKLLEKNAQDRINMREEHQKMRSNNETPSEEDRYNAQVAQLDKQIALKSEMKKILNDTQYEKWSKQMGQKMKQMKQQRGKKSHGKRAK